MKTRYNEEELKKIMTIKKRYDKAYKDFPNDYNETAENSRLLKNHKKILKNNHKSVKKDNSRSS